MDLNWLIGKTCTRIDAISEGVFSFEFGDCGINVACAWRLVENGQVALADRDHGQPYGLGVPINTPVRGMQLLGARRVVAAVADDVIGDIRIEFERSLVFEVFNDSSGYEAWSMTTPDKYVWVAASGGEISGYPSA